MSVKNPPTSSQSPREKSAVIFASETCSFPCNSKKQMTIDLGGTIGVSPSQASKHQSISSMHHAFVENRYTSRRQSSDNQSLYQPHHALNATQGTQLFRKLKQRIANDGETYSKFIGLESNTLDKAPRSNSNLNNQRSTSIVRNSSSSNNNSNNPRNINQPLNTELLKIPSMYKVSPLSQRTNRVILQSPILRRGFEGNDGHQSPQKLINKRYTSQEHGQQQQKQLKQQQLVMPQLNLQSQSTTTAAARASHHNNKNSTSSFVNNRYNKIVVSQDGKAIDKQTTQGKDQYSPQVSEGNLHGKSDSDITNVLQRRPERNPQSNSANFHAGEIRKLFEETRDSLQSSEMHAQSEVGRSIMSKRIAYFSQFAMNGEPSNNSLPPVDVEPRLPTVSRNKQKSKMDLSELISFQMSVQTKDLQEKYLSIRHINRKSSQHEVQQQQLSQLEQATMQQQVFSELQSQLTEQEIQQQSQSIGLKAVQKRSRPSSQSQRPPTRQKKPPLPPEIEQAQLSQKSHSSLGETLNIKRRNSVTIVEFPEENKNDLVLSQITQMSMYTSGRRSESSRLESYSVIRPRPLLKEQNVNIESDEGNEGNDESDDDDEEGEREGEGEDQTEVDVEAVMENVRANQKKVKKTKKKKKKKKKKKSKEDKKTSD